MKKPTVYLVLPACHRSAEWMAQLLTMLAGGYDLGNYQLQPVVLCPPQVDRKDVKQSVAELTDHYAQARNLLQKHSNCFCATEVEPPMILSTAAVMTEHGKMFWQNQVATHHAMQWIPSLKNHLKPDFQSGDRLVLSLLVEHDASEFSLAEAILSCFKPAKEQKTDAITVVCEVGAGLFSKAKGQLSATALPAPVASALRFLQERCQLVVTGIRDDAHKTGFTCVQHASAILDAICQQTSGEPVVHGGKTGMSYSPAHLASASSARSLQRMSVLGQLQLDSQSDDLALWHEQLRIRNNDELWGSAQFEVLNLLIADMMQWQQRIDRSEMAFSPDMSACQEAVASLNKIKRLDATSTQEQRRQEALRSLLQATDSALAKDMQHGRSSEAYRPLSFPSAEAAEWYYELGEQPKSISPTELIELTDMAFHPAFAGNAKAKVWRSACLDLWELFFLYRKDQVESYLTVTEHRLSLEANTEIRRILELTPVGRKLLADDIFYRIADREGTFVAFSSPLTGFCIATAQGDELLLGSRRFISKAPTDAKDLRERSKELQALVYAYTSMQQTAFLQDGQNFRDYVLSETKPLHTQLEAKGADIIRQYPQFRDHIGAEIIENTNPKEE